MRRALAVVLAGGLLGCGEAPLNGCEPATAVDATGRAEVEVGFGGVHGYAYEPACLRVSAGTRVRFRGRFDVHPLGPGAFEGGRPRPEPSNPIRDVAEGSEAAFRFSEPGRYGFQCHLHAGEGMLGAVFVEPAGG